MNATLANLQPHVQRDRLVETALALIEIPSPTGDAGQVSDRLASLLEADGFLVDRPTGGHDKAPAVAVRLDSGKPGPVIQFTGHLDTVHLPFVPPRIEGDLIRGSGASDMKAGVAAAVEALRALRDSGALRGGSVLFTAHDLHESPWGDGRQFDAMIREGYVGDAVLLPEPLSATLPAIGRGLAVWKLAIQREGPPVHEVMRPEGQPSVIHAAARLIGRLERLAEELARGPGAIHEECAVSAGSASVFVGQVHAGEIYNQNPTVCRLEGTRRWLPGADRHKVEREFRAILGQVASETGTTIDCEWIFTRDAFYLDTDDRLVQVFQGHYRAIVGEPLPFGPKPFVDDGNSAWALAGAPAITHGPRAGGQHTVEEWVSIDDLVRVALQYAATAVTYCGEQP